jgi:NADH-quinone oxidoreductase subunit I
MATTLRHFFLAKPVTIQYPEEKMEMPPWTRGRPRLIYEVDNGELRCTSCGACAIACPVDVIKIEYVNGADRKKILERFDLDMGGCIECALCVEACPFRAIVMAPDFELGTYDRQQSLVFNMHQLRIPGTPEVDSAMEYIQGVKRGRAGQEAASAQRPGPAARAAGAAASTPARPAPRAADAPGPAARPAPAAPATPTGTETPAAPAGAPAGAAGALARTADLEGLSPSERARIYKERAAAAGIGRAPKADA